MGIIETPDARRVRLRREQVVQDLRDRLLEANTIMLARLMESREHEHWTRTDRSIVQRAEGMVADLRSLTGRNSDGHRE